MRPGADNFSRRDFLERSALGLTGLAILSSSLLPHVSAAPGNAPNPFALNTEGMRETDPKLISHTEVARFAALFPEARRLSVSSERIHVAAANSLRVLDLKGEQKSQIDFADPVRCAAEGEDGRIYVGFKNRVEVLDAKGLPVAKWEAPGGKAWLSGMAISRNDLFVADSGNRMVLRYDLSGKLIGRIGEKNKERGIPGIILPSAYLQVAMGKDGLLRVNNSGRHRVELYTPEGDLELHWGVAGGGISGFCGCCNPIGIAVLPDGKCITCEKGVPRVKLYEADGTFASVVAGAELFPNNARAGAARRIDGLLGGLDAAVGPDGKVYVLDLVSGEVRVMIPKAGGKKA